jgi:hypothetical protein
VLAVRDPARRTIAGVSSGAVTAQTDTADPSGRPAARGGGIELVQLEKRFGDFVRLEVSEEG